MRLLLIARRASLQCHRRRISPRGGSGPRKLQNSLQAITVAKITENGEHPLNIRNYNQFINMHINLGDNIITVVIQHTVLLMAACALFVSSVYVHLFVCLSLSVSPFSVYCGIMSCLYIIIGYQL